MAAEPVATGSRTHVALLRGINVGTAKRVPMETLRSVVASLGGSAVATLLNSGNVVFALPDKAAVGFDQALRSAVLAATGVDAEVIVVDAAGFRRVAAANPLRMPDRAPNRVSVAFPKSPLPGVDAPAPEALAPEELVLTAEAVYQWFPDGQLQTKVPAAWWRSLGTTVTARNDATVQKLVALLDG